ncbi:hypothetical protein [Chitinolyticbacter meiyuanensis]|uniref:hypothetical protein n=1 Tax=Chitinolyticbacter meiyuanensis TaxID=682798 RepID=UPI0011E5DEEE|nr:hypothetical protein [Chitinolyticbacter meiyuanensis]
MNIVWDSLVPGRSPYFVPRVGWRNGITELQLTVTGDGAVSVTLNFYGSNDGIGLVPLGTLAVSGTATPAVPLTASDSITRPYRLLLAELVNPVTGAPTRILLTQSGV